MTTATLSTDRTLPTDLKTVAEFEEWQQQPGNDGNFEFVRGRIIPKSMKQNEIEIVDFLVRRFIQTAQYQQNHILYPELDSYVDNTRKRIPDLTYFTAEQRQAMRRGERANTLFAIEILSDSESHQDVLDKIQDYFDGGAQLLWYIVPKRQKIYAYTSPDEWTIFKGQQNITAAPVIPDFEFTVADLFV
ncbi:Uma2 family endonuclease [Persicitalea sp.]|uniref:Uma2 family endonuclease n=1 Tax=Persicitalea sp. TaxID=3100273 RepID=UPI0035931D19